MTSPIEQHLFLYRFCWLQVEGNPGFVPGMPNVQGCHCGKNSWGYSPFKATNALPVISPHLHCLRQLELARGKIWVTKPFAKAPKSWTRLMLPHPIEVALSPRDRFIPIRFIRRVVHTPKIHYWWQDSPRKCAFQDLQLLNPDFKMYVQADGKLAMESNFWQSKLDTTHFGSERYDEELKAFWQALQGSKLVLSRTNRALDWFRSDVLRVSGIRGLRYTSLQTFQNREPYPKVSHVILLSPLKSVSCLYKIRHFCHAGFVSFGGSTHHANCAVEGQKLRFWRNRKEWISAKSMKNIGIDVSAGFLKHIEQSLALHGLG